MKSTLGPQPNIAPLTQTNIPHAKDEKTSPAPAVGTPPQTPAVPAQPRQHVQAGRVGNKLRAMLGQTASKAGSALAKNIGVQVSGLLDQADLAASELSQGKSVAEKALGVLVKTAVDVARDLANDLILGDGPKQEQAKKELASNPALGKTMIGPNWSLDQEMAAFGPDSGFRRPGF